MKKLLCTLILAVILLSMCSAAALADPKHVSADELYARVDAANARIQALVDHAIQTPENDVKALLHQIDKIVHDVQSYAKKLRMEVGCEMVYVEIDGQTVGIDPLYVVNIRQ